MGNPEIPPTVRQVILYTRNKDQAIGWAKEHRLEGGRWKYARGQHDEQIFRVRYFPNRKRASELPLVV